MSVTIQDLVYFGVEWQDLQASASDPTIALGGGWENAQVIYKSDGGFFAGVAYKVNVAGQITDVVIAFAGAQNAQDLLTGESMGYGLSSAETTQAEQVYDSVFDNPAYANATIHVTGHSLGAGFSEYLLGYSVSTYGKAETAARGDFTGFGTPAWAQGVATASREASRPCPCMGKRGSVRRDPINDGRRNRGGALHASRRDRPHRVL